MNRKSATDGARCSATCAERAKTLLLAQSTASWATKACPASSGANGTAPRSGVAKTPHVPLTYSAVISRPRPRIGSGSPTSPTPECGRGSSMSRSSSTASPERSPVGMLDGRRHSDGHHGAEDAVVATRLRWAPRRLRALSSQRRGQPVRPRKRKVPQSIAFAETLVLAGIAVSTGSVGDAYDNALAESTIGLFKTEAVSKRSPFLNGPFKTIDDVEFATMGWVDWFNQRRLHSTSITLNQTNSRRSITVKNAHSARRCCKRQSGKKPGTAQPDERSRLTVALLDDCHVRGNCPSQMSSALDFPACRKRPRRRSAADRRHETRRCSQKRGLLCAVTGASAGDGSLPSSSFSIQSSQ